MRVLMTRRRAAYHVGILNPPVYLRSQVAAITRIALRPFPIRRYNR